MIWQSSVVCTPSIEFLVVCGLLDTMEIFSPIILLRRVDFPAFARPQIAINPDLNIISPLYCMLKNNLIVYIIAGINTAAPTITANTADTSTAPAATSLEIFRKLSI